MDKTTRDNRSYRGLLQSNDGVITRVLENGPDTIRFRTAFGLSPHMIRRLKIQPEHIVFSERSRIARLGIQISCEQPSVDNLEDEQLILTQEATPVIPGYPGLDELRDLLDVGLPVGRLVFCDPEALLTSEEVLGAIERAELKLPASTSISSDGSIVIAPHKVVCEPREKISREILGRILLQADGREMLNRFQIRKNVPALVIPPGKGVITTCSMYLNDHYVVLQSGFALGRNLPATVLDPIKTRGIQIYLEIVNGSRHPIVNPLISARIYGTPKYKAGERRKSPKKAKDRYAYSSLKRLENKMAGGPGSTCHFLDKPMAVIHPDGGGLAGAAISMNGPDALCPVSKSQCAGARRDFSIRSPCAHAYATSRLKDATGPNRVVIALKYFPNLLEHRDIVNAAAEGKIESLYFFEASCEHGPFLSQEDHSRLQEYHAFGLNVYWVCGLNRRLMVHTMRDGKGYFVTPERLAMFHKSMLFAFYGSTHALSKAGEQRLGELMDALVGFWGQNIGILTGGGSGVMEVANTMARKRGVLSGANFLDITDQPMTTDVDFCQVFQATCRHSRQKWFEIASFPIFNIGGLGSLEELGITLCNMKLSITEQVPVILFDTEGNQGFWEGMQKQITTMVARGRAPEWIGDHIVITDDPQKVIAAYRKQLQLF
jgi:predicted Rossmann-fold nucleotide-binding protein